MEENENIESEEITIKEVSTKLDISESTVKKYIKDFDLGAVKGSGNKALITKEVFQAVSEIAKLRANGLSIQEIKELKSQEPTKHILDEIDETQKLQEVKPLDAESNQEIDSSAESITVEQVAEIQNDLQEQEDLNPLQDVNGNGEEKEEKEEIEPETEGEGPRRRRGFNYRYVERQISSDSKRVSTLRLRLKNPNLSVQDRLFFEEALDRRILFLNGWKHILRWVSKG